MFDQSRDPGLILGIDPGLSRCGYGAVRRDGHRMVPVAFGVLRTPPEAPLPERLAQLQADLDALFDDLMPSGVAVERILFQVNARTGEVQGARPYSWIKITLLVLTILIIILIIITLANN